MAISKCESSLLKSMWTVGSGVGGAGGVRGDSWAAAADEAELANVDALESALCNLRRVQ